MRAGAWRGRGLDGRRLESGVAVQVDQPGSNPAGGGLVARANVSGPPGASKTSVFFRKASSVMRFCCKHLTSSSAIRSRWRSCSATTTPLLAPVLCDRSAKGPPDDGACACSGSGLLAFKGSLPERRLGPCLPLGQRWSSLPARVVLGPRFRSRVRRAPSWPLRSLGAEPAGD